MNWNETIFTYIRELGIWSTGHFTDTKTSFDVGHRHIFFLLFTPFPIRMIYTEWFMFWHAVSFIFSISCLLSLILAFFDINTHWIMKYNNINFVCSCLYYIKTFFCVVLYLSVEQWACTVGKIKYSRFKDNQNIIPWAENRTRISFFPICLFIPFSLVASYQ